MHRTLHVCSVTFASTNRYTKTTVTNYTHPMVQEVIVIAVMKKLGLRGQPVTTIKKVSVLGILLLEWVLEKQFHLFRTACLKIWSTALRDNGAVAARWIISIICLFSSFWITPFQERGSSSVENLGPPCQ